MDFEDLDPESLNGVTVRKHNDLIEAKYQIPNIQEQRVIFMLLAQIKPEDEDFKGYRISVTDFANILGVRPDNMYERLEATAYSLLSRTLKIKNGKSFLMANWLSSAEYRHGTGYVELCFDPKLKPYLLQLKDHFTQYKLDSVLHFKSVYSIRLYEMLKKEAFKAKLDPESKTKRFQVEYSYEEMREFFGIEKKEYTKFNDFKRFTIIPAVTEIYDKTDLNIYDVVYGKTGRAISRILFKVELRSKADADIRAVQIRLDEQPKEASGKEELKTRLQELGYSPEYASRDVNKYGKQRIERSIAYTLAMQKAGEVKNFPAYLSKVIEGDLGGAWETALVDKKAKEEQAKQVEKEKEAKAEKKRQEQKARYEQTLQGFYALDEEAKEEIENDFVSFLKEENEFIFGYYKKAKEETEQWAEDVKVRGSFISFLMARGF